MIPPNYGEDLTSGQPSQALVLIDGSDPTVASAALSAAELAGQAHGVSIKTQQLSLQGAAIGGNSNPVDVRTDVLYNPDLLGAYSIVPGLIALNSFSDGNQPHSARHRPGARAWNDGALIVTPIRSWELILAKITPYILVSFADTLLILVLGTLIFGVPIRGSIILLFAMTGLYLLPTLGYGLVISTIARTQQQAQLMVMPLMLPAMMLSGYIFPIASLPIVLQYVGALLPTTYFIYIMRAVVIKGVGISLILPQILALSVFAVALLGLAMWRFRKNLD